MPNHCLNILKVHGTPDQLNVFRDKAREVENLLTFAAFVPMPDIVLTESVQYGMFVRKVEGEWCELWRTAAALNLKAPDGTLSEQQAWLCHRLAKLGYEAATRHKVQHENDEIEMLPDDLLDVRGWRCQNWGTKWDAYDFDDTPAEDPSSSTWTLTFYTAWAPPAPVIHAVPQQHPELSIELRFSEPANGLLGAIWPDGTSVFRDVEFPEVVSGQEDVEAYFAAV